MMSGQIDEARRLFAAGEKGQALECCRAAIDLAGDDLDAGEAKELLARIETEQGKGTPRILAGLDALPPVEEAPAEEIPQEEFFGDRPDEIFEVHLETLPPDVAEIYRGMGAEFRDGFLSIQEGRPKEAIDRFASAPESAAAHPVFRLEKAQALLLDGQNEAALAEIEWIALPEELARRRTEMRVILLERLDRKDEAEDEARRLWEGQQDVEAAVLYAELLIDHGHHPRAVEILKPHVHPARPQPDIDGLAARAYAGAGEIGEARNLLERAVESFFQGPVGMRDAPRFPVWAARELLGLYTAVGEPPDNVRSLVQHLIRHDPSSADHYKEALARYAEERERAQAHGKAGGEGGKTAKDPEGGEAVSMEGEEGEA